MTTNTVNCPGKASLPLDSGLRSRSDLSAEASSAKAEALAQIKRRRVRPEQLISNSIFGLCRHGAIAATYLALAYAAKVMFGISLSPSAR